MINNELKFINPNLKLLNLIVKLINTNLWNWLTPIWSWKAIDEKIELFLKSKWILEIIFSKIIHQFHYGSLSIKFLMNRQAVANKGFVPLYIGIIFRESFAFLFALPQCLTTIKSSCFPKKCLPTKSKK